MIYLRMRMICLRMRMIRLRMRMICLRMRIHVQVAVFRALYYVHVHCLSL